MLLAAVFLSPSLGNLTKVVVKKLISLAISNRQIDCDFHCKMRRSVKNLFHWLSYCICRRMRKIIIFTGFHLSLSVRLRSLKGVQYTKRALVFG